MLILMKQEIRDKQITEKITFQQNENECLIFN